MVSARRGFLQENLNPGRTPSIREKSSLRLLKLFGFAFHFYTFRVWGDHGTVGLVTLVFIKNFFENHKATNYVELVNIMLNNLQEHGLNMRIKLQFFLSYLTQELPMDRNRLFSKFVYLLSLELMQ